MYLVCKVTRFYGISFDEQKQMRVSVWVDYLRQLPILSREEIAIQASVIEPIVYASLIAPQEKRTRGISAIQKLLKFLKGDVAFVGERNKQKRWKGRLSEAASKRLDVQVKGLVGIASGMAGKVVVKRDISGEDKNENKEQE